MPCNCYDGAGLKRGDEVILHRLPILPLLESNSFIRLTPVFVDVDPKTFCLDIEALKGHTPKTKPLCRYLSGHAANMEALMQVAKAHTTYFYEDNARPWSRLLFKGWNVQKPVLLAQLAALRFTHLKI